MSTGKAVSHTAKDAFKRVKPLLDVLKQDIRKAATIVSKEYDSLPKLEKKDFAAKIQAEYGWSRDRLSIFARIGREFPKKAKLISSSPATTKLEDFGSEHMAEIMRTPDKLLKKAADEGMFSKKVSKRDIRSLRQTGKIPVVHVVKPKNDLDKIRVLMVHAEDHMRKASLDIGKIAALMYDSGITDAKGKEATALVKTFEKLCTEVASVNPITSKRAFQILRGEA